MKGDLQACKLAGSKWIWLQVSEEREDGRALHMMITMQNRRGTKIEFLDLSARREHLLCSAGREKRTVPRTRARREEDR